MKQAFHYLSLLLLTFSGISAIVIADSLDTAFFPATVRPIPRPVVQEPTMQEWVLNTIEQASLNKYEAYDIIKCESGWDPYLYHVNGRGLGVDRGLWELSDKYHSEVSNKDAFDYKASTLAAIQIYKKTNSWREWICARILKISL